MLYVVIGLSFYPQLGQSCSCSGLSGRFETLRNSVCWGEVYSGVVIGATCSCIASYSTIDCREYSYTANDDSYTSRVLTRVELNTDYPVHTNGLLKTCLQTGKVLSQGIIIYVDVKLCVAIHL